MKKIILVLIAFFVFNSCKEAESPNSLNQDYIYAYVLNAESDFISVIGGNNNSDGLLEINKYSLNGNKFPYAIGYVPFRNELGNKYIGVVTTATEVNDGNYGKIWGTSNLNKILLYNDITGKLFQEIQLKNISYNINWVTTSLFIVGQCGETKSSLITYSNGYEGEFFKKEEFVIDGSLGDFKLFEGKFYCLFPNEGKLRIYNSDLYTINLVSEINIGGNPNKVNFLNLDGNSHIGVLDKINKKITIINLKTLSISKVLNLDYEPSDFSLDKSYNEVSQKNEEFVYITSPNTGNVEVFKNVNGDWIKSTSIYSGKGCSCINSLTFGSYFVTNTEENTVSLITPSTFKQVENIKISGKKPIAIVLKL